MYIHIYIEREKYKFTFFIILCSVFKIVIKVYNIFQTVGTCPI